MHPADEMVKEKPHMKVVEAKCQAWLPQFYCRFANLALTSCKINHAFDAIGLKYVFPNNRWKSSVEYRLLRSLIRQNFIIVLSFGGEALFVIVCISLLWFIKTYIKLCKHVGCLSSGNATISLTMIINADLIFQR